MRRAFALLVGLLAGLTLTAVPAGAATTAPKTYRCSHVAHGTGIGCKPTTSTSGLSCVRGHVAGKMARLCSKPTPPPARTPPPPPAPTCGPLSPNDQCVDDGNGGTAKITLNAVGRPAPGPNDNNKYGGYDDFDVTIVGVAGNYAYNELQFNEQEPDGRRYSTGYKVSDNLYGPGLNYGNLAPGQTVRGTVAVDCPSNPGTTGMLLNNDYGGNVAGRWTFTES